MRRPLLIGLALACVLVIALTRKPHVFEFVHFWLTAKYFPEVRYAGLYGAVTGALEELYGEDWVLTRARAVRDLESGALVPAQLVLAAGRAERSRWEPGRWRSFCADVATLKEAMDRAVPGRADALWGEALRDHGVNYPPAWIAYTHLIARSAPLTARTIVGFTLPDVLSLSSVFAAAGLLWGLEGAALALVFAATGADLLAYATWAFCKLDWLALLAAGLLALRRGWFPAAGALWGLAAAVRIFPAAPALLFAVAWHASRRQDAGSAGQSVRFLAGAAAGFAVPSLLATALLAGRSGLSAGALWLEYAARIGHYSSEARMVNRVGVRALFEAAGAGASGWIAGIAAAALAFLLLAAIARSPRPPERTAVLCLFFIPLLVAVNHFYYLLLALPLAARERALRGLGAALIAVNLSVIAAKAAGADYGTVLESESLAYSAVLAAVPLALFFRGRGAFAQPASSGRSARRGGGEGQGAQD